MIELLFNIMEEDLDQPKNETLGLFSKKIADFIGEPSVVSSQDIHKMLKDAYRRTLSEMER